MDPKLNPTSAPDGVPGVTLKVIGAGFSRTGTKTFGQALTILYGLPVHDAAAQSLLGRPSTRKNWLEVMDLAPHAKTVAEKQKLKYLLASNLEGYICSTDTPVCHFTEEIAELYPDALVIATTRDKERWHNSLRFMEDLMCNSFMHWIIWPVPKAGSFGHWNNKLFSFYRWKFGTETLQPEHLEVHENRLRKCKPEDRLHFYSVKDGWAPLCKLLGKDIPDVPFPHNNDRAAAKKDRTMLVAVGLSFWVVYTVGLGLSARYLWSKYLSHDF